MKKRKRTVTKRSPLQTIAQKRNWVKRLISCYTAGYRTVIHHYADSISSRERANIESMMITGSLLLDNWTAKKKE
jgi:hypothetical protein